MLPEIGECIFYLEPESVRKEEEARWQRGVYAGIREESSELYVITETETIKIRSFARLPEN